MRIPGSAIPVGPWSKAALPMSSRRSKSKHASLLELNDDILLTLVQWLEALELLSWGMVCLGASIVSPSANRPPDMQAFAPDYQLQGFMDQGCSETRRSVNTLASGLWRYDRLLLPPRTHKGSLESLPTP
jgi:hypothetical protein